ncbi:hypothetical protein M3Y99_01220900 [Aphelenchoides fujianensis]|nr:hypothetical protein M3Y99_01220900 [Aphelenchoides fujianensis]
MSNGTDNTLSAQSNGAAAENGGGATESPNVSPANLSGLASTQAAVLHAVLPDSVVSEALNNVQFQFPHSLATDFPYGYPSLDTAALTNSLRPIVDGTHAGLNALSECITDSSFKKVKGESSSQRKWELQRVPVGHVPPECARSSSSSNDLHSGTVGRIGQGFSTREELARITKSGSKIDARSTASRRKQLNKASIPGVFNGSGGSNAVANQMMRPMYPNGAVATVAATTPRVIDTYWGPSYQMPASNELPEHDDALRNVRHAVLRPSDGQAGCLPSQMSFQDATDDLYSKAFRMSASTAGLAYPPQDQTQNQNQ